MEIKKNKDLYDVTTRATYNESTKKLEFSAGDKLFVKGPDETAGQFAGTLEWQSGGTFSGTIYTQNEYSGTADAHLHKRQTSGVNVRRRGWTCSSASIPR